MVSTEIYIKLLGINVGRNVCQIIESVLEQLTNIRLAGPLLSPATTGNLFTAAQILTKTQEVAIQVRFNLSHSW